MRTEPELRRAMDRYGNTVQRLCMVYLKNEADTDDIFQTVFMKYAVSSPVFENDDHEKAWMIRVTVNACRDLLRSFFRSRTVSLEDVAETAAPIHEEHRQILEAVLSLPEKYRTPIYLHYYEGYTAPEIGGILGRNPNTVYTHLNRGIALLREKLGGDELEPETL